MIKLPAPWMVMKLPVKKHSLAPLWAIIVLLRIKVVPVNPVSPKFE